MVAKNRVWPDEHVEALKSIFSTNLSFAEMAARLNAQLGTNYSRSAIIGRSQRLGFRNPVPNRKPNGSSSRLEYHRLVGVRRREARWAANPMLRVHYERKLEREKYREQVRAEGIKRSLAHGDSKTSAGYRKFLPRIGELSKDELRAMLAEAVQNTAAMESQA